MSRQQARDILLVAAVAIVARLLCMGLFERAEISDSVHYQAIARDLAAGNGWAPGAGNPTQALFRPPLYPLFLSVIYALGGSNTAARLVQILLSAGSALFVMGAAGRIFGRRAGLIAGLLFAIHPYLIQQSLEIMTEELFTFLYLGGIYFLARSLHGDPGAHHIHGDPVAHHIHSGPGVSAAARPEARDAHAHRRSDRDAILSGLFLGIAILCRPNPLAGIPFLAIGIVLAARQTAGIRAALRRAVLLCAACVIAFAPWIVRNLIRYDAVVPIATTGEFTLYLGNSHGWAERVYLEGAQAKGQDWDMEAYRLIPEKPPGWFQAEALRTISSDPARFAKLTAIRTVRLLKIFPDLRARPVRIAFAFLSYTILFPLGVAGLVFALRRRKPLAIALLPFLVAVILPIVASIPSPRYRFPLIDAVLLIFAGGIVERAIELAGRSRSRQS